MPPPPPPPGPPKPPPAPQGGRAPSNKGGGGATDRNDLLKSIQQGKALKKTVTNDRSGPIVEGKNNNNNNHRTAGPGAGDSSRNGRGNQNSSDNNGGSAPAPRLPGIGGLFGEGFPKLKPTGSNISNSINKGTLIFLRNKQGGQLLF